MTDEQIATVASIISAGRLCVGWDDPGGPMRRIVAIEMREEFTGEPCGVLCDSRRMPLRAVKAVDIVAYFRPFALL